MPLTKTDLTQIKEVVKEVVKTEIEKSEKRIKAELGGEISKIQVDIKDIKADIKTINRNLDDMIETDQRFLEILGNQDQRITRLETKVVSR